MSDTYVRTVQVPTRTPTAKKSGLLNRAMKDYLRARQLATEYFREHDVFDFSYSDREELRKRINADDQVTLLSRAIYPAINTAQQNYEQMVRQGPGKIPDPRRADVLALPAQNTHLFHSDGRYYLNAHAGLNDVTLPLRTTEDAYHADRLPHPADAPDDGKRPGRPFADFGSDELPAETVSIGTSTLKKRGDRDFIANIAFDLKKQATETPEAPRYIVGVDRGRNQLATAAVYDRQRDHVVDWYHRSGDEVEHRMDRYAKRIREFQRAGVWGEMEDAKMRRYRYKKQIDYEIANAIVDLSQEYDGTAIAIEELSKMNRIGNHYRQRRRFAEWSYGRLGRFIEQKAEPYSIPVHEVEPAYTSQECSRCGSEDTRRDGVHFRCRACDYTNHADSNAAVNIAKRAVDELEPLPSTSATEAAA